LAVCIQTASQQIAAESPATQSHHVIESSGLPESGKSVSSRRPRSVFDRLGSALKLGRVPSIRLEDRFASSKRAESQSEDRPARLLTYSGSAWGGARPMRFRRRQPKNSLVVPQPICFKLLGKARLSESTGLILDHGRSPLVWFGDLASRLHPTRGFESSRLGRHGIMRWLRGSRNVSRRPRPPWRSARYFVRPVLTCGKECNAFIHSELVSRLAWLWLWPSACVRGNGRHRAKTLAPTKLRVWHPERRRPIIRPKLRQGR